MQQISNHAAFQSLLPEVTKLSKVDPCVASDPTGIGLELNVPACRWWTNGMYLNRIDISLESKIQGNVFIDLCCGMTFLEMKDFAKKFDASGYVGIDRFTFHGTQEFLDGEGFPCAVAGHDVTYYLSKLKTAGCKVISLNGVDDIVIKEPLIHKNIAFEITRVIANGGIVMGCNSAAFKYLESGSWHRCSTGDYVCCFERTEG
jgi:hypothetical protein